MLRFIQWGLHAILFILSISAAHAQSFSNFQEFSEFLSQYTESQVSHQPGEEIAVRIMQLDENMPLPTCPRLMELSLNQQQLSSNSNNITVRCRAEPGWTLYVPVQIQIMTNMLTAARLIKPGERISAEDIREKKEDKNQLYDRFYRDKNEVIGQVPGYSHRQPF